jgi:hypothetical protein
MTPMHQMTEGTLPARNDGVGNTGDADPCRP